jgi:hypothetical protein
VTCAACGADLGRPERVGRRDVCPRCGAELHACRQCRFYDPRLADACREPQAERLVDKTRANFCDYFAPPDAGGVGDAAVARRARVAPSDASAGADASGSTAARDALERLFRR